jgi:hypothetical protein
MDMVLQYMNNYNKKGDELVVEMLLLLVVQL